jgi:hypothetical protein
VSLNDAGTLDEFLVIRIENQLRGIKMVTFYGNPVHPEFAASIDNKTSLRDLHPQGMTDQQIERAAQIVLHTNTADDRRWMQQVSAESIARNADAA